MSEEHIKIVPQGDRLEIWHGNLDTPFVYKGRKYELDSLQSFIDLVVNKGSKENSVVFFDYNGVRVILDDTVKDRPQDTGSMSFKQSDEFKEWVSGIFGGNMQKGGNITQKNFVEFLRHRELDEVDELESLMASVQQVKFATIITGEAAYDDPNNITFAFKMGDSEGMGRLPKVFTINLPLVFGSAMIMPMEVEMEFVRPKSQDEKPYFTLSMPKFQRYWKEAVEYDLEILSRELEDYLLLGGNPK